MLATELLQPQLVRQRATAVWSLLTRCLPIRICQLIDVDIRWGHVCHLLSFVSQRALSCCETSWLTALISRGFEPGTAIFGKCKKATTGPLVVAAASQSEIAVTTPFLAYDWAITVAWASSDLDSFKPASAPLLTAGVQSTSAPAAPASVPTRRSHPATSTASAASAASTATQTEDLGSHSTTSAASPTSASGLSTAAKAGIGVGAALGCLLILVLVAILVLMLRRQRQKRRDAEPGGHGQAAWRVQSSSTGNSSYFANQARAKQNGSYPYSEMDGARPDQQYPYAKPELEDSRGANPSRYYQAELAGS